MTPCCGLYLVKLRQGTKCRATLAAGTHLEKVATSGRGKFSKSGEIWGKSLYSEWGNSEFPHYKKSSFPQLENNYLLIGEIPYLLGEILYVGISLFPHHCSQVPQWEC